MRRDRYRRQEESPTDDRPYLPTRRLEMIVPHENMMLPHTSLYPTRSNFERHGIAIGNPVEPIEEVPNMIGVPTREISHCSSQLTMPASIIPSSNQRVDIQRNSDDYMDDEELEIFLQQMSREEARKEKQRKSLQATLSHERKSFQTLLSDIENSTSDFMLIAAAHSDEYLERLIQEQIRVEEQYNQGTTIIA